MINTLSNKDAKENCIVIRRIILLKGKVLPTPIPMVVVITPFGVHPQIGRSMIDTFTRKDVAESFIATRTNTTLEEKVIATKISGTVVTIRFRISTIAGMCHTAPHLITDEE